MASIGRLGPFSHTFYGLGVRFGPFEGDDDVCLPGERLLFGRGKFVLGVGGDCHWCCGASQAVPDAAIVLYDGRDGAHYDVAR
jgi:hypothetical protein